METTKRTHWALPTIFTIQGVTTLAAIAALLWVRAGLGGRVEEVNNRLSLQQETLEQRLASVSAGIPPIHKRCEELAGVMGGAQEEMGRLVTQVTSIEGGIGSVEEEVADGRRQLGALKAELRADREQSHKGDSDLLLQMDEQAEEARNLGASYAALVGQVNLLATQLSDVPVGTILPWIPSGADLPHGWQICDGTAGTPDLRGLFLRGVGSTTEANLYYGAEAMQQAGVHSHATSGRYNITNQAQAGLKNAGEWLILYDAGYGGELAEDATKHGAHVHADTNVPAHFTVIYITKQQR